MNRIESRSKMSFEEMRRRHAGQTGEMVQTDGDLFETDWEVFVARYDAATGTYKSRTFCCDSAVSCGCCQVL